MKIERPLNKSCTKSELIATLRPYRTNTTMLTFNNEKGLFNELKNCWAFKAENNGFKIIVSLNDTTMNKFIVDSLIEAFKQTFKLKDKVFIYGRRKIIMPKFTLPLFLCLALSFLNASNDFVEAGKAFKLDPRLLWAIAYKESRHSPHIISKTNKNGSYDIGIMQINSSHLTWLKRDYGINEQDLLNNPRTNIYVGAMILRQCFNKYKTTQTAITCYNGKITNNPYGKEVLQIVAKAEQKNRKQLAKKRAKNYFKAEKQKEFIKVVK